MRKASVVLVCVVAFASAAGAQSAAEGKKKSAEPVAQDGASAKKKPADSATAPASGNPDTTTATFGDWSIVCTQPGGDKSSCEVSTAIVLRNQAAPFARVAVVRAAKDDPVRLAALVPVNVTTQSPLRISTDGGRTELSLPIKTCTPAGCLAEVELGKDVLQALGTPAKSPAQLTIVDATGKAASVSFSLRGLDDALAAYFKP